VSRFIFGVTLIAALASCTPALFPELTAVAKLVLADVTAGDGAEQVEADVAKLLAGQPGVDVVVAVNDAITILIDLGYIPAGFIPQAKALQATEHAKIEARGHK
jgi:hypothetical protein